MGAGTGRGGACTTARGLTGAGAMVRRFGLFQARQHGKVGSGRHGRHFLDRRLRRAWFFRLDSLDLRAERLCDCRAAGGALFGSLGQQAEDQPVEWLGDLRVPVRGGSGGDSWCWVMTAIGVPVNGTDPVADS